MNNITISSKDYCNCHDSNHNFKVKEHNFSRCWQSIEYFITVIVKISDGYYLREGTYLDIELFLSLLNLMPKKRSAISTPNVPLAKSALYVEKKRSSASFILSDFEILAARRVT